MCFGSLNIFNSLHKARDYFGSIVWPEGTWMGWIQVADINIHVYLMGKRKIDQLGKCRTSEHNTHWKPKMSPCHTLQSWPGLFSVRATRNAFFSLLVLLHLEMMQCLISVPRMVPNYSVTESATQSEGPATYKAFVRTCPSWFFRKAKLLTPLSWIKRTFTERKWMH